MKNNAGSCFMNIQPWEKRTAAQNAETIAVDLMQRAEQTIADARFIVFSQPPILGMSLTGGFEGYIQNRGDGGSQELAEQINKLINKWQ